ncbi:hypothetical protein [Nocardia sp. NPDC047654]|uniref:hypothetical protein n=1 Tax=Nocardia sp. NPDC047654 TaxID=3364314 RepID=UPI00372449BF
MKRCFVSAVVLVSLAMPTYLAPAASASTYASTEFVALGSAAVGRAEMSCSSKTVMSPAADALAAASANPKAVSDEAQEWDGDHTAIDVQLCLDTGGSLDGSICVGGPYSGYITQ